MMKMIKSSENENIKSFSRLYKRKYRDRSGMFVIEGITLLHDAIQAGIRLDMVIVREDFAEDRNENALSLFTELENIKSSGNENMRVYCLPASLFDRIVETETPQGIAAAAYKPDTDRSDFFNACSNIVVLDRLQDPGNLGTILRTAEAAGFEGVLAMKGTADLFSPKTVRSAAGSIYRSNISYADEPEDVLNCLHDAGKRVICTSPHSQVEYFDADLSSNFALVIGNEAGGACETFMEKSDINVTLPMEGRIESLNAAVAASVVMYESLRQRICKERET